MGLHALILAGGEGLRFRPFSTPEKPKQFIRLTDPSQSLLQQTYGRLMGLMPPANIWVATHQRFVTLVREQLPQIAADQIFGETEKKNTAPCLAWAAYHISKKDPEAVVVALPSDHFIEPVEIFQQTLSQALKLAEKEKTIVTLGVPPTHPSTQYGYIYCTDAAPAGGGHPGSGQVKKFVEKPDAETAQHYLADGNYFWNSGIFIFTAKKMLACIQEFMPEVFSLLKKEIPLEEFFAKALAISIDYAVMERAKNLRMIPAKFVWSDVGTWESLKKLVEEKNLQLPSEIRQQLLQIR